MGKILRCRDAGFNCNWVARGQTDDEILQQAAKHVKEVHNWTDAQVNDPQTQQKLRSMIQEEQAVA